MASGRFLSTSIAEDDRLSKLSLMAEFIYLKTIPHLDRDGMISGKPGLLYSRVCPTREEMFGNLQSLIDEWIKVGLVTRFDSVEGPVLFFPGFLKNNNLPHYDRERASKFPPPPGYERHATGLIVEGTEPPVKQAKKPVQDKVPPKYGVSPEKVQDEVQELVLDSEQDVDQDEVLENELQEQDQEEDKDQEQDQLDEDDTPARDPRHQAWFETYQAEMPTEIETLIDRELGNCSDEAVLHAIRTSVNATERTFRYLKKCALNYLPPPPEPTPTSYTNGYHVDLPGVHILEPAERATPPPPLPPPMNHDDPWAVALSELLPTLSTQAKAWLEHSELSMSEIAGEPLCEILVSHPDANIQWLIDRTEPLIRKKLGSLMRKRVNVAFIQVAATPVPTIHGEIA